MNNKVFDGKYTLEQLRQNLIMLSADEIGIPRTWLVELIDLALQSERSKTAHSIIGLALHAGRSRTSHSTQRNRLDAFGIIRRIDDIGRIAIPREVRRSLNMKEGSHVELFWDDNGDLILRKYNIEE